MLLNIINIELNETPTLFRANKWKIFIYFLERTRTLGKSTNHLAVMVNVTTMYSVLIGFDFSVAISMIIMALKRVLRFAKFYRMRKKSKIFIVYKRYSKYLFLLRLLLASIGFLYYLPYVYLDSINSKLFSSYIDTNLTSLYFPTVGLCFNYYTPNQTILDNLTGYDLEEMTSNLTVKSVFDRILYIDPSAEEKIWKSEEDEEMDFEDNFHINAVYYRNKKCFDFAYELNVKELGLNKYNHGLRIKLKDNLPFSDVFYYTRAYNGDSISRFYQLDVDSNYQISFDKIKITYADLYQGFRNPLFWLLNPVKTRDSKYLYNLREEFARTKNHSTLLLPLTEELFELTVRNDLFEKFCDTEVANREKYVHDENLNSEIYKESISEIYSKSYTFSFSKRIFEIHQVCIDILI